jgi:hypothetical protein
MKSTELPALIELRESLREAAVRDVAARRPRRRRRRGIAIFAVVLLGGAAAAGAADLISSGEPVKQNGFDTRYQSNGQLRIDVKADDEPLPWGVQAYTSTDGKTCALAGRVRAGVQLGLLDAKGVFHKYGAGHNGVCGSTETKQGGYITALFRDGRSVIYGRVRAGASSVTLVVDAEPKTFSVGPAGSFLAVYRGRVMPSSWTAND